eukprot:scaffold163136_cov32-Tisochrysis_lutea.AAC.10
MQSTTRPRGRVSSGNHRLSLQRAPSRRSRPSPVSHSARAPRIAMAPPAPPHRTLPPTGRTRRRSPPRWPREAKTSSTMWRAAPLRQRERSGWCGRGRGQRRECLSHRGCLGGRTRRSRGSVGWDDERRESSSA